VRLAYVVSHPIQYQAPLLRRIAQEPGIDLTVLFGSDFSTRGYLDQGFGTQVAWDTPLVEGYPHRFLPPLYDPGTVSPLSPISRSLLRALRLPGGAPAFDAVWVHGYASINALRAILAANHLGIPVLLRAESWLGDRPRSAWKLTAKRSFLRALRPAIAATLPIGTRNALYWHTYFGPDMPQFLMPYAVDNQFFAQQAGHAETRLPALRHELQLAPGRPVVLLEAFHRVHGTSSPDRRPCLVIVGDGEERATLEARARALGLEDVRFAGFRNQTELPAFFALADLFVLPSRHEPWGLIVNEAMAAGCPVIVSSEVGAAADLVTDGVEGFVFPAGDVTALADVLTRSLADPARLAAMGLAARRRVAAWDFEADIRGLRAALAFTTRRLEV
jgi:glycosyltransferase involved in cell wall biosynthesis